MYKNYQKIVLFVACIFVIVWFLFGVLPVTTIGVSANTDFNEANYDMEIDNTEQIDNVEQIQEHTKPTLNAIRLEEQPDHDNHEREYFSDDSSWEYTYHKNDGGLPYYLFSPSEINGPTPIILWLHGSGERNVNQNSFMRRGLMPTLSSWSSEGVNAYIICPQLAGNASSGRWNTQKSVEQVQYILDIFIDTHNIDVNRIYIAGHSLGGQGCLYIAAEIPEYFAACASLSPYNSGADISLATIPIVAYVGDDLHGEDGSSIRYANELGNIVGHENIISVPSSHGDLPRIVFSLDENDNGRSDVIEWFFSIEKMC